MSAALKTHGDALFVSGSIALKKLPETFCQVLDRAIERQLHVIVGDARGVDFEVQRFLADRGYPSVTVFHLGAEPRNLVVKDWDCQSVAVDEGNPKLFNKGRFTRLAQASKDEAMAVAASFGLAYWLDTSKTRFGTTAVSKGTLNNMLRLLSQNKPVSMLLASNPELGLMKMECLSDLRSRVEMHAAPETLRYLESVWDEYFSSADVCETSSNQLELFTA